MTNEKIMQIFNSVYAWWKKWRNTDISVHSDLWNQIVEEVYGLMDKYDREPLVVHMVNDLLNELERRAREEDGHSA